MPVVAAEMPGAVAALHVVSATAWKQLTVRFTLERSAACGTFCSCWWAGAICGRHCRLAEAAAFTPAQLQEPIDTVVDDQFNFEAKELRASDYRKGWRQRMCLAAGP